MNLFAILTTLGIQQVSVVCSNFLREGAEAPMETKTWPSVSAEILSSPRAINTMETKTLSKGDYNVRTINPHNPHENDDAFILSIMK